MTNEPPEAPIADRRGRARGCNVLMLLILLALVAALAGWAWLRNPPQTPSPSGTSSPATVPGGVAPSD